MHRTLLRHYRKRTDDTRNAQEQNQLENTISNLGPASKLTGSFLFSAL